MVYVPDDKDLVQINNNFVYHPVLEGQQDRYVRLRDFGRNMALEILKCAPSSRERSLAITKLEEAVMWANAAIARNEKPSEND